MVDLSYRDHNENMASGNPNMLSRVAQVAREAACNIYSKSPAAWLANEIPGTPLLDAHRALMDTLCDGVVPPPPPPPPPFVGGQCCGVNYFVNVQGTLLISNGQTLDFDGTATLFGKIGDVVVENSGSGTNEVTEIVVYWYNGPNCDVPQRSVPRATQVNNSNGTTSKIQIDSVTVTRTDGLPDTCGNPPGVYPPPNVTINDYDYNTTINFSPGNNVSTSVSITPTLVLNDNRTGPSLNVSVGGINVSASLGGFTFSPTIVFGGGDKKPSYDPRPTPPPTRTPDPAPTGGPSADDIKGIKDDLDDIKDDLDELKKDKKPAPPPPPDEVSTVTLVTANSGTLLLPAKTFKVTLELTERPSQEKIQYGMQGSDVIYAGWAWFRGGLLMSERMPVDAPKKVFAIPERIADGFDFTLYAGYTAIIRAYYYK